VRCPMIEYDRIYAPSAQKIREIGTADPGTYYANLVHSTFGLTLIPPRERIPQVNREEKEKFDLSPIYIRIWLTVQPPRHEGTKKALESL